jgi:predicted transposase/invertase (TIGR01784 family)
MLMDNKKELLKPKYDVVFQSLFTQKNEEITRSFISALLEEDITSIKINEEKELYRDLPEDKLGILDLEAEINNNERIDIEVQLIDRKELVERLLFYYSRLYTMRINKGDDYAKAQRVVIIAIIDYNLELTKEIKNMETIWNMREKENKELILTDKIELRIIELSKAKEEYEKNKSNEKAQWMMFLNNPNEEEVQDIMKENEGIKKATVEIVKMSEDEKMERLAFLRKKAIMDEKSIYAAGLDKGETIGISKGEKQKTIEIAKKMKAKGKSINEIMEITELTKEEIEKL